MRYGASFLLFWQEQGQFCLDKPLDEYQRVSHEKPLIFNPALYLTKPWKWIVNKRRAKASLLSLQITESVNSCWTEPRELQVLFCEPEEVLEMLVKLYINYTFILYLLRIYIDGNIARKNDNPWVLSHCTKCMPLSPNLIFTYNYLSEFSLSSVMNFSLKMCF